MSASGKGFLCAALLLFLVSHAEAGAVNEHVVSVTSTSATLRWTAPGDDGDQGKAWRYDLRFSSDPISGTDSLAWWNATSTNRCSGLPDPGEPGSVDSFVVTGLLPERTYYFVLRTADEMPNWSYFSNVAVVTTPAKNDSVPYSDEIPPGPVAGLSAWTVDEGINLSWMPSPDADVVGYYVYRSIDAQDFNAITSTPLSQVSYLDTNVLAGVTYYYSVTAVDDADNESPISQSVSATAPSGAPSVTRLLAPFPDPCVSQTVLRYEIKEAHADVTLRIFDAHGRLVRDLLQERLEQGQYSVVWNLREDNGRRVSPGVYVCAFATQTTNSTKKLVVLR
ncbi:MAG: hypothetical protein JSW03_05430 [Candidatus Eiseniibacteriota bacterium]|nr:MAG: hypothetical protein JSW03_05430 [Candidatus Eisenbacteria bacterium]